MANRPRNSDHAMENTTQFDLNTAIHAWRQDLAGSPAFRSGDLDELESHLRDSVIALQDKGLSPYETFWVARSRLGTRDAIGGEFGKVNPEQVWLHRALWMVFGSVAIGALSNLVSVMAGLATLGIYEWPVRWRLAGPFSLTIYLVTFIGLFLFVWRSGRRGNGVVGKIVSWARTHPVAAPIAMFLAFNFIAGGAVCVNILTFRTQPVSVCGEIMQWRTITGVLPAFFWPVALAWLMVRTARNPVVS